jgi:acetyl esterase/lipase
MIHRALAFARASTLAACLLACGAPASSEPFAVNVESGTRRTSLGDSVAYDLYLPVPAAGQPPAPWPALVLNHGFARSKSYHAANARYLAERGLVVLVPNLVSLLGGELAQLRNIANTVDHLQWLRQRAGTPGDALHGLVDAARLALAGHSAGGAIAFEAGVDSQRTPAPAAAVLLLDAVPWTRTLARAGELPPMPLATLRADPSSCNATGSVRDLLDGLLMPALDVSVLAASHCDPENPSDGLCGLVCTPAQPERQALFQQLAYLFLREALRAPAVEADVPGYLAALQALAAEGRVGFAPVGPIAAARLRVNGVDPGSEVVTVSSPVRVTLDVIVRPGDVNPAAWYLAYRGGTQVAWLTPQGLVAEPTPLAVLPPLAVQGATVLAAPLAPDTVFGVGFALTRWGSTLTEDRVLFRVAPR